MLSIEKLGTKKYLDLTADDHNGHDYAEFVTMVDRRRYEKEIAKLYGTSIGTIARWKRQLRMEKSNVTAPKE